MYIYTCVLGAGANLNHPVDLRVLMNLCPGEVIHYRPTSAGGGDELGTPGWSGGWGGIGDEI